MKPGAHVQAAIELIDLQSERQQPADKVMANFFRQRRYMGSKDKRAVAEYFYAVLRQKASLQYLLSQQELKGSSRLVLACLLVLSGQRLSEYFSGEQYCPRRLNSDEFQGLEKISSEQLAHAPSHIRLNVPTWLEEKLQTSLGEAYEAEMEAANQRASTDIRVNELNTTVEEVSAELDGAGLAFEKGRYAPWCLRLLGRASLSQLPGFKAGHFEVQDEGSQLLALLADARSGHKVVDFCAGAGGKSLALAGAMQNKGVLYACDVHSKRLEQLSLRAKRAGVHNLRVHCLSSENDKWVKQHKQIADLVLIDAPCSGTGTWRRNPDSRWNLKPEDLTNLVALQQSILQSASRLVKPGGRLIYATCSLLDEENQQQVSRFLDENDHFTATRDWPELTPEALTSQIQGHELRLLTSINQTDGFYMASMHRNMH